MPIRNARLLAAILPALLIGPENARLASAQAVEFTSEASQMPPAGPVSAVDAKHACVGLAYTADAGASWTSWNPLHGDNRFLNSPAEGQNTFFLTIERGWLSGTGAVWATDDGGATWRPQVPGHIHAMAFVGRAGYLAAGNGHSVKNYTTTDAGRTWVDCGSSWELSRVAPWASASFIDPRNGWVTTANYDRLERPILGGVARTTDGGCTWTEIWRDGSGVGRILGSLQFVDSEFGWLVAPYASLLATSDGGRHWRPVKLPGLNLESAYLSNRNSGWVAGGTPQGTAVFYTADGGSHWAAVLPAHLREDSGIPSLWGYAFLAKAHQRQ